jgi:hypothetical protein
VVIWCEMEKTIIDQGAGHQRAFISRANAPIRNEALLPSQTERVTFERSQLADPADSAVQMRLRGPIPASRVLSVCQRA